MDKREKTIELQGPVGLDPDVAAEVVWQLTKHGGEFKITRVTIERRALQVTIGIPPTVPAGGEQSYSEAMAGQLVELVKIGVAKGQSRDGVRVVRP